MFRLHVQRSVIGLVAILAASPAALAQSKEFSDAVLALPSTITVDQRQIADARLFGGLIRSVITNQTGSADDFEGSDQISFLALPRSGIPGPTGLGFTTPFVGTRDQFETWAQDNAADLLRIFFPGGLSTALTGRDSATLYSQQLLLTTVFGADDAQARGRGPAGGLIDVEWLHRDQRAPNDSAWALQGLYAFSRTLSVQGRYSSLRESLSTSATSAIVDYHPFIERGSTVIVRIGGTAHAGFLYSSTDSVDLVQLEPISIGALDFGGGGWVSAQRQVGPVLLGGGALFQATKQYQPTGEEGTFRHAFATAMNNRGPAYDLTLGATARVDVSAATSFIVRYADTLALESAIDRPAAHLFMGGVMYALGPGASLNTGYKWTGFSGATAHSIYFQGNFGW